MLWYLFHFTLKWCGDITFYIILLLSVWGTATNTTQTLCTINVSGIETWLVFLDYFGDICVLVDEQWAGWVPASHCLSATVPVCLCDMCSPRASQHRRSGQGSAWARWHHDKPKSSRFPISPASAAWLTSAVMEGCHLVRSLSSAWRMDCIRSDGKTQMLSSFKAVNALPPGTFACRCSALCCAASSRVGSSECTGALLQFPDWLQKQQRVEKLKTNHPDHFLCTVVICTASGD